MKTVELLAPAKDYASAAAAVDYGADAVYIGGAKFGARQAAGNSAEEIARVVEYAHRYGVRVHATLNTLVNTALSEAQIESMVIAKGFADCVTYITDDTVSVAVAAPAEGLSEADAALISDVVRSQTDYPLSQVRIIEVKP